MNVRNLNWPLWLGFLLVLVSAVSFPLVFVNYPSTRDFPWATLLMFAVSAVVVLIGLRRAFSAGRKTRSKVAGVILTTLSVAIIGLFIFGAFVFSRFLPAAPGAPQVGQKAPAFTLLDTNSKPVSLAELLSTPLNGKAPKGVFVIFYRGYW
jgi:cation transport ATPase